MDPLFSTPVTEHDSTRDLKIELVARTLYPEAYLDFSPEDVRTARINEVAGKLALRGIDAQQLLQTAITASLRPYNENIITSVDFTQKAS